MVLELTKLLFELSSNERRTILLDLQNNRLKLSHIAKKLNLTVTETSRHLQRLSEDILIEKDVNGTYGLTSFGILTLSLLSGLRFVAKHRDYFLNYDVSNIPSKFIIRIGEIGETKYSANTFRNIDQAEDMLHEAQKFIWIISDQSFKRLIPIMTEKTKLNFDARIILPEDIISDNKATIPSIMTKIQAKTLQKINIVVMITEKWAGLCFPNRNGRIDYTGFIGTNQEFHEYCEDLFLYYWQQANPISRIRAKMENY